MTEIAWAVLRQLLLFSALLLPVEILAPARAQRLLRRGLFTDLAHFVVDPFLVQAGATALLAVVAAGMAAAIPSPVRAALAAQPFALQIVEIFVASEVLSYWAHRASHEVRWLWRFHAVHHSATELSWLAAHRQHPIEAVWLLGVSNLPLLALGFQAEPLLGFILAQKLYTALLHANLRLGYGRLDALVASPRFHHWHHDASGAPCNFAATLSILDRLWGTWRVGDGFPDRYGVDEPVAHGWLGQLLHPLRRAR